MLRWRRIREFIPCEPAPNLNRCAGWTRCPKPGRLLVSCPFSKFRFPLANRIRSWRPFGCPFSVSLLTFLFLVFTLNLLNLLAKWKCTCLAKKKLTITAYFPYSSAFLPLIVILYSHTNNKSMVCAAHPCMYMCGYFLVIIFDAFSIDLSLSVQT